ncbi:hypothetical protein [Nocardiopsis sp. FIRDI 009]|uniref:hypothetical protein n=1 Tax=Nocardiopsis sp. FIRDI 009 TaxID=714197 RepID=UPI00130064C8|nr:hypothetical protein [Nocardiopsis sp. FIRDI 009]
MPSFDGSRDGSVDQPWSPDPASSLGGEPWNAGDRDDEPWSPGAAAESSGAAASPLDETDQPWSSEPASPSADAPWGTGTAPADPTAPAADEQWDTGDAHDRGDRPWAAEPARADEPQGASTDRPWTPDSALDRVNEAWSPGTPPANEPWTPGAPTDDGLGPRPPMPSAEGPDPLAPPPDSWADDELGADSWGTDARRSGDPGGPRAWDERTDDLDAWASARDGDGAGAAEPWTGRSTDGYDDELSPAPTPVEQDPPGGGTGNTWVFDRDDARLPDSVREAERRRRENGPAQPEFREWGADPEDPDTGALSAAVPSSDDPLGAIAEMQTRARSQDEAEVRDADQQPGGATQMFDALSFDDPEPGADRQGAPAYDDGDYDDYGDGYDDPRYTDEGYADDGYPEDGYADDGYAGQPYDSRYHDTGYDEDTADGYDDAPRAAAPGVPSDLGPAPEEAGGPQAPDSESAYDDGFTPADYGMPVDRSKQRRRRDPIASDFPGFDDRPPGGEVGDAYPGYDSIEFLADTDRGALVTLWLGLASLLPGIGLVTAAVALFVTGPKAKRAIRGSNGQLDGLGLITTGTVFAVVGILVTVISVAFFFVL